MLTQSGATLTGTLLTTAGDGTPLNADALPTGFVRHNGVTDTAVAVTVTPNGTGDYLVSAAVPGTGYADYDGVELFAVPVMGGATLAAVKVGQWTVLATADEDTLKADIEQALGNSGGGGSGGNSVVQATGTSRDYHTYDDTDTDAGSLLNTGDVIKVYAGENAHGLGWNLPGVRLGTVNTASVVIAPSSASSGQATPNLSGATVNMVQDGATLLIRLDWPSPLTDADLPQGTWVVSVSYTLDGETDVTSRLMIVRL